ncbi:MAG TPA: hypothetical protein VGN30_09625, partial [Steroidobacteraceae bacterium]
MSESRPSNDAAQLDLAACSHGIRDKMLVGLVLFTLVRSGEALAGDQMSIADGTLADADHLHRSSPPARA